jgi:hypothetical protein
MKKVSKIALFFILTIVVQVSVATGNNTYSKLCLNPSLPLPDSTDLISMIRVDSFRLAILPPSSGVQFYKDGIVFLASSKNEKGMSPEQISFGTVEAYYAFFNDSLLGVHKVFSPFYSFSYPCDAITFSNDYNYIYYTEIPKKEKKEKIFRAKLSRNSKNQLELVPESTPLDFCKGNYSYSHPALSADENMLVFASDMEGTTGGMDLFVTRRVNGKWSVPENLGKNINTSGNEFFPFLDSDNNLFFSSDGLPGYGGYDIFTCKFNGSGWDKPINLTDRINSKNDDIAFTINKTDGKTAFFSRRQKSGKSDIQLFRVTLKKGDAYDNMLTLSNIFNGKPVKTINFTAATSVVASPDTNVMAKNNIVVLKKEEPKIPDKTDNKATSQLNVTNNTTGPVATQAEAKPEMIKPKIKSPTTSAEQKDVVIYRVQFLTSNKPGVQKKIIVDGKSYDLYEYFYLGAYRYTIGEFTTLASAVELQNKCRRSGISQAFVVAFKNNTRSLDTKLFK